MTTAVAVDCPACGAPVPPGSSACPSCALRLVGPEAYRLWVVNSQIAALRAEAATLLVSLRSPQTPQVAAEALGGAPAGPMALPSPRQRLGGQQVLLGLGALLLLSAVSVFAFVAWALIGVLGQVAVLTAAVGVCVAGARGAQRRSLTAAATTASVLAVGISALMAAGARELNFLGAAHVPVWSYATGVCVVLAALWASFDRLTRMPGTGSAPGPEHGVGGESTAPVRPGVWLWSSAAAGVVGTFCAVAAATSRFEPVGPVASATVWWAVAAASVLAALLVARSRSPRLRLAGLLACGTAATQVGIGALILLAAGWAPATPEVLRWQVAAALFALSGAVTAAAVYRIRLASAPRSLRAEALVAWAPFAALALPVSVVLVEAPVWVWATLSLASALASSIAVARSRVFVGDDQTAGQLKRMHETFAEIAVLVVAACAPLTALVVSFLVYSELSSFADAGAPGRVSVASGASWWAVAAWAGWSVSCVVAAALSWVPTRRRLDTLLGVETRVSSASLREQATTWCAGASGGLWGSLVALALLAERRDLTVLSVCVGLIVVVASLAAARMSAALGCLGSGGVGVVGAGRLAQAVERSALFAASWGVVVLVQALTAGWSGFATATVMLVMAAGVAFYASAPGRFAFAYLASGLVALANAVMVADTAGGTVVECFTVPAAVALGLVGGWQTWLARRAALHGPVPCGDGAVPQTAASGRVSSVVAWGPTLSVALLPSLAVALNQDLGPRLVIVFVAALLLLAVGLVRSSKAPVVFGGLVTVIVALTQAGPYVAFVPSWVLLASGGVVLLVAGVAWERALAAGKAAVRWLDQLT